MDREAATKTAERGSGACARVMWGRATGWRRPPAANGRDTGSRVARYLRLVDPVVRSPVVVVATIAVFAVADRIGDRGGLALVGGYVLFLGTYCVLNFWHCREAHCAVTGAWTVVGLLGLAAALFPGAGLAWYRLNVLSTVFLVILAAGCALECAVAARTGRRVL